MTGTYEAAFVGHQPIVEVTERMLLSSVPENERLEFMRALGTRYELNRSGEPVFLKSAYTQWKQSQ